MNYYYRASMVTWRNNHSDWETVWVKASNLEEAIEKIESEYTLTEECEDNVCTRNGVDLRIGILTTAYVRYLKGLTSNGFSQELRPEYTSSGLVWVRKKKYLTVSDREQYWVF